jgi:hypothetical protein
MRIHCGLCLLCVTYATHSAVSVSSHGLVLAAVKHSSRETSTLAETVVHW